MSQLLEVLATIKIPPAHYGSGLIVGRAQAIKAANTTEIEYNLKIIQQEHTFEAFEYAQASGFLFANQGLLKEEGNLFFVLGRISGLVVINIYFNRTKKSWTQDTVGWRDIWPQGAQALFVARDGLEVPMRRAA